MGNDDAVPLGGGRPREEPLAPCLGEVHFVGDEDARGRVELEELAAGLGKAVAGHHHHRLGDQTEALLLHHGGGHGIGLAGADGVGDVRGTGRNDPPDHPLLVRVEIKNGARAGKLEVRTVEVPWDQVVEPGIVDRGEALGPRGIGPHPVLERGFDRGELLLGSLGLFCVELAPLVAILGPDVPDLRDVRVEGVVEQLAGMPARGTPCRAAGCDAGESARIDGPVTDLRDVPNLRRDADHLLGEGLDDVHGDPGSAKPRRDLGRLEIDRLGSTERLDVGLEPRIARRGLLGPRQLLPDLAGKVRIGGLPAPGRGIEIARPAKLGSDFRPWPRQELGDVVEIDLAGLVQAHRKRIGSCDDGRLRRRVDDPSVEDRASGRLAGVGIVLLDRRDQPNVGVVSEDREIGPTHDLVQLAGVPVGDGDDLGAVDWPVALNEACVRPAQPALRLLPGLIGLLRAENVAHRVADRDQRVDHLGMLPRDPLPFSALDRYGDLGRHSRSDAGGRG